MSGRAPARRVAMFVLNDMRFDSRVDREARTLAESGFAVTVYAVMSDATSHLALDDGGGYRTIRVPMLMRPTGDLGADPGRRGSQIGRRALVSAFLATRPLLGGTLHFAANWQLRWRPWARAVMDRAAPADVWHAHDFNTLGLAAACAARFGGRLVYDSHELFTEAGSVDALPSVVLRMLRARERAWAQRADAVLTVNESVAKVLEQRLGTTATVVHNCATRPAAGGRPLRSAIGVSDATPTVLYHGSVVVGRGLETLVASFDDARLAAAHLVIMGYGTLRPRLEALASTSAARNRIHLLPPVPPRDVTSWVAGADVAAMPIEPTTMNHRLSSPNKMFEAIAAGVPVLGPDFPEFRRVVNDPQTGPLGVLHREHDPGAIADGLHAVLGLPQSERNALRERCRRAAQRWSWDVESGRLLAVYHALLRPAAETEVRAYQSAMPVQHKPD